MSFRTMRIMFAGFGGQGLLFAGKVIATAGLIDGREVTWLPSYGPEMRGGTANCMVCVSDEDVNSPLVLEPDVLVAMNKPSLVRFEKAVKSGGTLVLNRDLIDIEPARSDLKVHWVPADAIAAELGNPKIANMAALGTLIGTLDIITLEQAMETVRANTPAAKADTLAVNLEALRRGYAISAGVAASA